MILDHDVDQLVLLHLVNKFEAGLKIKRHELTVVRFCILRNQALSHNMLMKDYLAGAPTYPAHLFGRRY